MIVFGILLQIDSIVKEVANQSSDQILELYAYQLRVPKDPPNARK
jgi:hypothetical protein